MIIGFDGSRAFVEKPTGTERYSFELLRALLQIDKKNRYIIYVRKGAVESVSAKSIIGKGNCKLVEIPLPRLWTQVGLAVRTWIDKLDLLFVPAHTLPILRKTGLSTVVTIHDLGYEYLPQYHQFPQKIYLNWSTEYAVKSASKIIAVSKATEVDLISKLHCDIDKIKVVYEGVRYTNRDSNGGLRDIKIYNDRIGKNEKEIFKKYAVKKPYILAVGTLQPRKNYIRLIEAFAKIKKFGEFEDLQLIICGKKGWKWEEILAAPEKYGVLGKVLFLGHVPDEYLVSLYQNAVSLAMPSFYEGFGLPVLEAMALGCPVVVSQTSSLSEVAGEAGILVNPDETDSIVSGIMKVLRAYKENKKGKKDNLYEIMIKKGYSRAKEFTWERAARETLEVFNNI